MKLFKTLVCKLLGHEIRRWGNQYSRGFYCKRCGRVESGKVKPLKSWPKPKDN